MTSYISGEATGTLVLLSQPSGPSSGVSASQTGSWTVNATAGTGVTPPAGAFYIGLNDQPSGNLIGVRSIVNGTNTVGTGILGAGILAQLDDISTTSITENNFGNLRIAPNRALMVEHRYTYSRATGDILVKSGAGFIHTLSIAPLTATPSAGLLTVYDSTTESGTAIYSEWVLATSAGRTITLDTDVSTGIYLGFDGTLANVQATISYR